MQPLSPFSLDHITPSIPNTSVRRPMTVSSWLQAQNAGSTAFAVPIIWLPAVPAGSLNIALLQNGRSSTAEREREWDTDLDFSGSKQSRGEDIAYQFRVRANKNVGARWPGRIVEPLLGKGVNGRTAGASVLTVKAEKGLDDGGKEDQRKVPALVREEGRAGILDAASERAEIQDPTELASGVSAPMDSVSDRLSMFEAKQGGLHHAIAALQADHTELVKTQKTTSAASAKCVKKMTERMALAEKQQADSSKAVARLLWRVPELERKQERLGESVGGVSERLEEHLRGRPVPPGMSSTGCGKKPVVIGCVVA